MLILISGGALKNNSRALVFCNLTVKLPQFFYALRGHLNLLNLKCSRDDSSWPKMEKQKPLALLIPGLDGTGRLYYRQVDPLSARYRVRPWEFRPRRHFTYADLVDELGAATSDEPPGSMVVVGESFGGGIALHYVIAFPHRVRLLALINTFPYYAPRLRVLAGFFLAPMLNWRGIQEIKNLLVDRILAWEGILSEDRRRYHEIIRTVDAAAYRRRLALVRELDLRGRLRELAVPTLLFASGRDKIVPSVSSARLMASRISGAELHVFPRAGHALLLTPGFSLADYL